MKYIAYRRNKTFTHPAYIKQLPDNKAFTFTQRREDAYLFDTAGEASDVVDTTTKLFPGSNTYYIISENEDLL